MKRREFLKQVALWSAGALLTEPVFRITPELLAKSKMKPSLSVAKGTDYSLLVAKALEPLGGIGSFVSKGDRVVVKPNIGWDRTPEQAANTHPAIVSAVVGLALEAGAREVLVFDRTCNEERRCYHNSGIKPALGAMKNSRVICHYIDRRKFVPVKIERAQATKRWSFYKEALEADSYINVPIAKHHSLAGLTMGLKNVMGVIGGRRGEIHSTLDQSLADLNTVIRPKVTIVDATRILLRNGPQGGSVKDVKKMDTVIASADIVAADAYTTTLFGKKPQEISSTVAASKMGLGEMNLSHVDIIEV